MCEREAVRRRLGMAWRAPFLPEMGGLPLAGALIGSVVKLSKGGVGP